MLPEKTRHLLFAVLLVLFTIYGSTVLAKTEIKNVVFGIISKDSGPKAGPSAAVSPVAGPETPEALSSYATLGMLATIIQGYDDLGNCSNDGSQLAKFFLCGTGDVRTISLTQTGGSYEWEQLDPNTCAVSVFDNCPTFNAACSWNRVGTDATFTLSAGGEYRVRVDSGAFYYFRASLNPLDPQLIKEDIICGNPGSVEVTNVPGGYEYSLNDPNGPYQDSPEFEVTSSGEQRVYVRLKNVSASACVFPSNPQLIEELDMEVEVTTTDILCSGEFGKVDVQVSGGVPGFFTYRLYKNGIL